MSCTYKIHAFKKDFVVVFDETFIVFSGNTRTITTCSIIELPERKIYCGGSVFNPHDHQDKWIGRRWAFKRAVYFMWIIWTDLKKESCAYAPLWQMFRLALGRNNSYLKERSNKENG